MRERDYDDHIREHYRRVASEDGLAPSSTMADRRIRELETMAIHKFISDGVRRFNQPERRLRVADLGCGNGYTVSTLYERFPDIDLIGIEKTPEMRELAEQRFGDQGPARVTIRSGDLRDPAVAAEQEFDVAICQRVLINLLDPKDQERALGNVVKSVKIGGALLFIEGFASALARLNAARDEFGMEPIPAAHHNLYLADDFFDIPELTPYDSDTLTLDPQWLSTHYYVSRVLHPLLLGNREFRRNSDFVAFLSRALPPGIGDYAQLIVRAFTRVA